MAHDHHHHHHHQHPAVLGDRVSSAFVIGIVLNLVYTISEAVVGWWSGSLALLTDAGHNLSDVGSLALSLLAFKLASAKPNRAYSYGYKKSTVLASLANAIFLLLAVGALGIEAVQRLSQPPVVPGLTVAAVAGLGIVINAFTAYLFFREQQTDLNIRGAYLHLLADAGVSLGVVVAGITLHYTGWVWIDPLVSFVVLAAILWGTMGLLRESLRLSLDGKPTDIDLDEIRQAALGVMGVRDIHHIHVWALSTTETALTAHLVMGKGFTAEDMARVKAQFRHALQHMNVHHATLEFECESEPCPEIDCAGH